MSDRERIRIPFDGRILDSGGAIHAWRWVGVDVGETECGQFVRGDGWMMVASYRDPTCRTCFNG